MGRPDPSCQAPGNCKDKYMSLLDCAKVRENSLFLFLFFFQKKAEILLFTESQHLYEEVL